MKVCVVNPNYYRSSGVTVAIRRIHQGTTVQGIDQYFVTCGYGQQEDDTDWVPTGKLQAFDLMSSNPLRLLPQMVAFLRWLRSNQIQVVHVHHRRLAALLNVMQAVGRFQLVYTAQLSYPYAAWFWLLGPRRGVAISDSVASNLRATTRISQIDVIGNPSDFPAECPPSATSHAAISVICVARLDPVKAHVHLMEAWRLLSDRNVSAKLLLVGEGSLEEVLQAQVRQLSLGHLVEFRGFQRDIVKELDCSSFAVLASQVEGHPVAVIEAASRGLPTLVTDVDGSRDCIPPQHCLPNLVPFGDAPALADAVAAWVSQPDNVAEEGRLFYDFHKERHSTEVVGRKYAQLYQVLV